MDKGNCLMSSNSTAEIGDEESIEIDPLEEGDLMIFAGDWGIPAEKI